jgi:hypothetical protein
MIAKDALRVRNLAIRFVDTRELHYSRRDADHHVCYELRGQQTNVWCVGASAEMLLNFYRYQYEQIRLAQELGLGTIANPNGLPYARVGDVVTVLENLTSNALDVTMHVNPAFDIFRRDPRESPTHQLRTRTLADCGRLYPQPIHDHQPATVPRIARVRSVAADCGRHHAVGKRGDPDLSVRVLGRASAHLIGACAGPPTLPASRRSRVRILHRVGSAMNTSAAQPPLPNPSLSSDPRASLTRGWSG